MPHLLLTKHNKISTPNHYDGVDFKFLAKSDYETKLLVENESKEFLLTIKEKSNNILVKVDTTTRVSPVSLVKKALNSYGKLSKAKVLFSNVSTISSKIEPKKEFLKDISYFVKDFKTTKEILIEVGFGSGRHLIYQALKNPDKLIIGLEIHTPSIEQMLRQVNLQNITNIIAVNYDARLFLEFIPSNSVGQIFVHFPVPWDKKPHRRVMSEEFIKEALRALKVNGTLELRTDSPNYYEYSKGLLDKFKKFPSKIIKNQDLEVISKYETRWKKQGKDIWDIVIVSTNNDKPLQIDDDFSFEMDVDNINLQLPNKPIVKDDFLVHFEDIFYIDEKDVLVKVTMGSFNKPINKYILIYDQKISYFQGDPIPTSANLKAHKLIKSFLDKNRDNK